MRWPCLFPIDWPEPFGLVLIEAMANGTPVIAFRRGSVPEIVDHGVTGFIVDSIDEAVAAVPLAKALDRVAIRRRFEERFSVERMARDYLALYGAVLRRGTVDACLELRGSGSGGRERCLSRQPIPDPPNRFLRRPAKVRRRRSTSNRTSPFRSGGCARSSMAIPSRYSIVAATSSLPRQLRRDLPSRHALFVAARAAASMVRRLLLLSSNVQEDNAVLTVDLANPGMPSRGLRGELIHVNRLKFIWRCGML